MYLASPFAEAGRTTAALEQHTTSARTTSGNKQTPQLREQSSGNRLSVSQAVGARTHDASTTDNALLKTIVAGDLPRLRPMLKSAAVNLNEARPGYKTASTLAAFHNNTTMVTELLGHGADVSIDDAMHGDTSLLWAARMGNVQMLEVLMAAQGIDSGYRNASGQNALAIAARNGHTGAVAFLAGRHMAVDQADKDGMTPMQLAARRTC